MFHRTPATTTRWSGWGLRILLLAGPACTFGCGPSVVNLTNAAWVPSPVPVKYDDRAFATILRENVKDGLVDYNHLKAHPEPLQQYLGLISMVGPTTQPGEFTSRSSQLAYFINAYNAGVLQAVLYRGIPETVHDVRLPPFEKSHSIVVDGVPRTLAVLRQLVWANSSADARVEFALCDAALGSPPLANQPIRPDTLRRDLREAAAAAMANGRQIRIDHERRELLVSRAIFLHQPEFLEFYARQTGSRTGSLLSALLQLAEGPRRDWLNTAVGYRIGAIPFDRNLNLWTRTSAGTR